jgi:hypothetical protein
MAVANPAPLMVATLAFVELQVTELVRFCVLLSLYVPVAVNCCASPAAIEGLAGVTAIDTSVADTAAVTVSESEALAVFPAESFTVTPCVNVPVRVGVPESSPVPLNVKPSAPVPDHV